MSATPIDGFRRNMDQTLPELWKECRARVTSLEAQLVEQRDALSYIERVASAAGVDVGEKKKVGAEDAPAEKGALKVV